MNKNKLEAQLLEAINDSLDDQSESLDTSTINRLRQMRMKSSGWACVRWLPVHTIISTPVAPAVVAMLVAIFSVSLVLAPGKPMEQSSTAQVDSLQLGGGGALSEIDILMSNEEMEFLDNLEIYEWLAAEYG